MKPTSRIDQLRAATPRDPRHAHYAEKLQRAIDLLGERWLLHPSCPAHYQCPDRENMNAPLSRAWYDPDRRDTDPRAKVIRQLVTAGNLLLTAALESHDQIGNAAEAWNFAIEKLRSIDNLERKS